MGQSLVEDSQNFTWSILEYFAPYDVYVQCIIKVTVSFCLALFFYKIILLRRKDLFEKFFKLQRCLYTYFFQFFIDNIFQKQSHSDALRRADQKNFSNFRGKQVVKLHT